MKTFIKTMVTFTAVLGLNVLGASAFARENAKDDAKKVMLNDFTDTRKPLVSACKHLKDASLETLKSKYFFRHIASENKDPLIETAAPALRYIFRAPGMQSAVETMIKGENYKENLRRSIDHLQMHPQELDVILQKSYNLHHLVRAVALKRELATDPTTMLLCEKLEKNLNYNEPYDANEAAKEILDYLQFAKIQPKEINYDPNYRSHVKLSVINSQFNVGNTWVAKVFAK